MINRTVTLYPNEISEILTAGEPTLEVETGTDSFGRALAAGDQATDVLNGNPLSALTIDTNAVSLAQYIAIALDRRVQADTAILLGLNARDTYPGDVRNNFTLKHHTSDVYGSATAVVPNSEYAGIIGRAMASLSFDGDDDLVTATLGSDGKFTASFTIEAWIQSTELTAGAGIITMLDGNDDGWRLIFNAGQIWASINTIDVKTTGTPIDGNNELIHVVAVFDTTTADGGQIYIDGVADGPAVDVSGQTLAITTNDAKIGVSSVMNGHDIVLYNRALSASEVLARFNGGEIATADRWGIIRYASDFSSSTDGFASTLNVVAEQIASATDGVTAKSDPLRINCDTTNGEHYTQKTAIPNLDVTRLHRMTLEYLIPDAGGTGGANPNVDGFDITDSGQIVLSLKSTGATPAVIGTWTTVSIEFTPSEDDIRFYMRDGSANSFVGSTTDVLFIHNIRYEQLGAVAEYASEGISDKWYDRSSNNLDGTISGADKINMATGTLKDIYVSKFTEINSANLYMDLNTDGLTGADNLENTGIIIGKAFSINKIERGSYTAPPNYPGVKKREIQGGSFLSNVQYGRRNVFRWKWVGLTDAEMDRLEAIYTAQNGKQRLLAIGVKEDNNDEKFYPVKFNSALNKKRRGKFWDAGVTFQEQATT